jgi:type II secretory pathway pseudopilin PulG
MFAPTSRPRPSAHIGRTGTDQSGVSASSDRQRGWLRYEAGDLRRDDGTTLIELTVGMIIMSIFLAMFTGAVVAMNRAENKAEAVSLSSGQLNQAFLTLDKTVRYAAAISTPGTGALGDWYVEMRSTNQGSEVCTQLRIDGQQLQRRTWTVTNAVAAAPTTWAPLTSYVSNGAAPTGATQPFVLLTPAAANNTNFQQLTFNLSTVAGGGSTQTTSLSSFTFTAIDSTMPASTAPVCQEQGRP